MRLFFCNLRSHLQKLPRTQTKPLIPSYNYNRFLEKAPLPSEFDDVDLEASPPRRAKAECPMPSPRGLAWAFMAISAALTMVSSYYRILSQLKWLNNFIAPETSKKALNALVVNSASYYAMTNAKQAGLISDDAWRLDIPSAALLMQMAASLIGLSLFGYMHLRWRMEGKLEPFTMSYGALVAPSVLLYLVLGSMILQMMVGKACGYYIGRIE